MHKNYNRDSYSNRNIVHLQILGKWIVSKEFGAGPYLKVVVGKISLCNHCYSFILFFFTNKARGNCTRDFSLPQVLTAFSIRCLDTTGISTSGNKICWSTSEEIQLCNIQGRGTICSPTVIPSETDCGIEVQNTNRQKVGSP